MAEFNLKKRHRMKRKMIRRLLDGLEEGFGVRPAWEDEDVDQAGTPLGDVYIVQGDIVAMEVDGKFAMALRGLLSHLAPKRFVTVDMGAVSYIYNGADVMAPGIKDADPGISPGDPVYVRDMKNLKPLAVGVALMDGETMVDRGSGVAVSTRHHVGDRIWQYGHEEDQ